VIVDSRDSARTDAVGRERDGRVHDRHTVSRDRAGARTRNVASESADPSSMLSFYRRLIALRTATPALRTGTFQLIPGVHRSVLAHWRRHPEGDRIVLVNFSSDPIDVRVPLPPELATGTALMDALSETSVGAIAEGAWTGAVPGLTAYVLAP
jgi:alpha-glucosidase